MLQEKTGFIGLGYMGKPMAENLVKKGFDIVVYDVRREPLDALQKLGAKVARSAKEVGELCSVIIVMVQDDSQAEAVILGKGGVLDGAKSGSVIIVTSTVEPSFCERAAKIAAEKGVGLIDAPVTASSASDKAEGTLTLLVGGEGHLVERCRPILEAVGKYIFHTGTIGMGQLVKLATRIIDTSSYLATTEAIAFVTKAGVSLERFLEIVRVSTGNSWAAQNQNWHRWWSQNLPEEHATIYYKDILLALDLSKNLGLNLTHLEAMVNLDIAELIRNVPDDVCRGTE